MGKDACTIRGQTLQVCDIELITAAKVAVVKSWRSMWKHIFPNAIECLVMWPLNLVAAILLEASLRFLGSRAQPPTPSWGSMLSSGRNYLQSAPWLASFLGIMILTVLGFNLMGDGLRDLLYPNMRGR